MKKLTILIFIYTLFLSPTGTPLCFSDPGLSNKPLKISEIVEPLLRKNPALSGAYVMDKGEESLLARAWLTNFANRSIDVQYFIWSTDNIGILASESLLKAAERGVKIRVIVDDLMIDAPDESMLALAKHPNIDIKIYNPKHSVGVSFLKRIMYMFSDFRSFNQRMHDKTFIVDSTIAITGGRNMADEYFDYDHQYNFRDRDILLIGPIAKNMQGNFQVFWDSAETVPVEHLLQDNKNRLAKQKIKKIYQELHDYANNPKNFAPEVRQALRDLPDKFPDLLHNITWTDISLLHDIPGKKTNSKKHEKKKDIYIAGRLLELVKNAKDSVTIQSPYLVMPSGVLQIFSHLTAAGTKVKISTNSLASTDNLQAFSGYLKQRKKILAAGIQVFEFKPNPEVQKDLIERLQLLKKSAPVFAIHAKTMVIDSNILFIGTFNFDPRSANLNTEIGVLIKNPKLAAQVEQTILTDMKQENSWNTTEGNPDNYAPLGKKIKTSFWKLFPLEPLL